MSNPESLSEQEDNSQYSRGAYMSYGNGEILLFVENLNFKNKTNKEMADYDETSVIDLVKHGRSWSYPKKNPNRKTAAKENIMNKNIKSVMTKKELEIVESGSIANVKLHSNANLKRYIQLTKTLRDKYRDIVDRHRGSNRHKPNRNNIEKVHIFGVVLGRFDRQSRKNRAAAP